jgi:1-acyl-sn-glycerol-3-phosphate acyltransferase
MMGWETTISFPIKIKKCVIIVGPHTSWWDVLIGALYRKILLLDDARFLGKKELFDGPFGFFFKWLGGTPVDRANKNNVVEQIIELYNSHSTFRLALSPEGTRKKVEKLRTGFYHIAKGANVPIIMVGLDFYNKQLLISEPFYASENETEDFKKIIQFYTPIKGKNPKNGIAHLLET